jgi:hypothetical protein
MAFLLDPETDSSYSRKFAPQIANPEFQANLGRFVWKTFYVFFKVDRCVPMYRSGRPDEFVKELPYTYVAQLTSSKLIHNFNPWKSSPKIYATSVIFKKLPIWNNHPTGANSPNLVALVQIHSAIGT